MGDNDKQIRIVAVADEASFAKSKRLVSELVSEVNKLVAATQRVNLGFGGGGGGGGFGARVSGNTPPAGGGSSVTQVAQRMGGAGGGLADNLSKAVVNSASLFKTAAAGSKDAFKVMNDALRSSVDQSDRDVKRLTNSLQQLEKTYERLKQRQARGGIVDAGLASTQGRYYETAEALSKAKTENTNIRHAQKALDYEDGYGAEAGGRQGIMSRVRGFMGSNMPSFGKAGSAMSSIASQIPGMSGAMRMMSNPLIAIPGAAIAAASYGLHTRASNQMANLDYNIDKPMMMSNARAQVGQVFGGNALALRHGDLARSIAMSRLKNDPDMKAIVSTEMDNMLKLRRDMKTPLGLEGMAQGNFLGSIKNAIGGKVGSFMAENVGAGQGGVNLSTTNVQQVARDRAAAEAIAMKSQMFQQRLEAKLAEDPQFAERMNGLYTGASGTLGMARSSGISNRLRSVVDAGGNRARMSGTSLLETRALHAGYETGEMIGGFQEMAGTVGRGFMHKGTESLLSAKYGGLTNVAQLRAMGSQYNGGSYGAFEKNIQGRIGTGGVDITAGSQISGIGAGMMAGGQFAGTGMGLMSTLMDAGFSGQGSAGDMRNARQMSGGVGAMGALMAGSIDPLQGALNASAAMRAAPGSPYQTHYALQHMDPATMMDAIRNEAVPPELAQAGVTLPMLKKYVGNQNSTKFATISESMLTPGGQSLLAKYKQAGGLGFLKGKTKTEINASLRGLSTIMQMGGRAPDNASALSALRLQAATDGVLVGGKGKGAHSAAALKGTVEGASMDNQAREKAEEGMLNGGDNELATDGIRNMGGNKKALQLGRKYGLNGINGSGNMEQAVEAAAAALMILANSIKTSRSGSGAGRPMAGSAK